MGKIADFFVGLDIFGHQIRVNYKGEDSFKTGLGAICTLTAYVLMVFNFVQLWSAFFSNSKMETSAFQSTFVPFFEDSFSFGDY